MGRVSLASLIALALVACRAAPTPVVRPVPSPSPLRSPPPPAWPVPLRILVWGEHGLEAVGRLPGSSAPTQPWVAEPLTIVTAAQWPALIDELRRHDVPGLALRDQPVAAAAIGDLASLPSLRYLELSGAALEHEAVGALTTLRGLTRIYLARTVIDDAAAASMLTAVSGLEVVALDDTAAGDRAAAAAAALPALRALSMARTQLTDSGGASLASAAHLEVLDASDTGAGVATATALAALPLTELYLGQTEVGRAGVALAPLAPRLVKLDLSDQPIDDRAVAWLDAAVGLQVLRLGGTAVTDTTVRRAVALPLRELELAETRTSARGAQALAAMTTLERLDLSATGIDDRAAAALLLLPALVRLRLDDTSVGDRGLAVTPSASLRELYLARTRVSDEGLAILDHVPELRGLGVRRTDVGAATVARIARLIHLTTVDVGETPLPRDALVALAALPELERLYLDRTRSGDAVFAALADRSLRVLHASGTDLTDASLPILRRMPLEELTVGNTMVTAEITRELSVWQRLHSLSLLGLPIDDDAAARLRDAPRLAVLDLGGTAVTTTRPLLALPRLTMLGLSATRVDDDAIAALAALPRLRDLGLAALGLDASILPVLQRFPSLRWLDLRDNQLSPRQIRRALPRVTLAD